MSLTDRAKAAMAALIQQLTTRYDYAAAYTCTVVNQNNDGTLELTGESPSMPTFSRVPVRYGIPDVLATLKPGARVLVTFENMDPSRPVATLFDAKDAISVNFAGGFGPLARQGDSVIVEFPVTPIIITGTLTLPPTIPGPFVGAPTPPFQAAVATIIGGNEKILA